MAVESALVVMELSIRSIFLTQKHQIKTFQLLMLELAWHLPQSPFRDPTCRNPSFALRQSGNVDCVQCTVYLSVWSEVKNRTWVHSVHLSPTKKWFNCHPGKKETPSLQVWMNKLQTNDDLSFRWGEAQKADGPSTWPCPHRSFTSVLTKFYSWISLILLNFYRLYIQPSVLCNFLFCEDLDQLPFFCVCVF